MFTTSRTQKENQTKRRALGRLRERVHGHVERKRTTHLTTLPLSLIELALSFLIGFDCAAVFAVNRTLNRILSTSVTLSPAILSLTSTFFSTPLLISRYRRVQRVILPPLLLNTQVKDWLTHLPQLVALKVKDYTTTEDVSFLPSMSRLRSLSFDMFIDSPLRLDHMTSLTSLHIRGGYRPPLSEAIHLPPLLQRLRIRFDDRTVSDENDKGMSAICSLRHLHTIEMWNEKWDTRTTARMTTILESLPTLTRVFIPPICGAMRKLKDGSLPRLTRLTVEEDYPIDLSPFILIRSLTSVELISPYRSVTRLVQLPPLTSLVLSMFKWPDLDYSRTTHIFSTHASSLRSLNLCFSQVDEFDYRVIQQLPYLTSLYIYSSGQSRTIVSSLFSPTHISPLSELTLAWTSLDQAQVSLLVTQCVLLQSLVLQNIQLKNGTSTLTPLLHPLPDTLHHLHSLSFLSCGPSYFSSSQSHILTSLLSPLWACRTLRILKIRPLSPSSSAILEATEILRRRGCAVL